jgi:hypothetical protein
MIKFPRQSNASDISIEDAAALGLRFPLDASQLPRLLNLRIEKASQCGCQRCGDLLEKLHTKTKLLETAHKAESPGLTFWLLNNKDSHSTHFDMQKKVQLSAEDLASHDELIDVLVSAEHDWQQSQRNNCTSTNIDTDTFWKMHYQDVKNHITELRLFEIEKLKNLTDTVQRP